MKKTQQKRADDFSIGEKFSESDGLPDSVIVSKMDHPRRSTRSYLLVRCANGTFTIYQCTKDAHCHPHIARFLPSEVLRQFLFDVFTGCELGFEIEGKVVRMPVIDIPKFDEPEAKPATPVKTDEETLPAGAIVLGSEPDSEPSCNPQGNEVSETIPDPTPNLTPSSVQTELESSPVSENLLPELDFL